MLTLSLLVLLLLHSREAERMLKGGHKEVTYMLINDSYQANNLSRMPKYIYRNFAFAGV